MSAAEMLNHIVEGMHARSVSSLPLYVKPFTTGKIIAGRKLTYMGKRKPPSEFALRRGGLIKGARESAGLSQAQLAEKLGLKSREIVSQYESGSIEQISERTCKGLIVILGLRPEDLTEDPSLFQFSDDLPTMSAEARRIARKWDSYPAHVREFIKKTMDGYDETAAAPASPKRTPKKKR